MGPSDTGPAALIHLNVPNLTNSTVLLSQGNLASFTHLISNLHESRK